MYELKIGIETLRNEIRHHDRKYYVEDNPVISDQEYDELMQKLWDLEEAHPELITPESPTQRVGGEPLEEFEKALHDPPMLSMDNTYNEKDTYAFLKKTSEELEGTMFVAELKLDGVGMALLYEGGKLVRGATRGDGRIGEDVTSNIITIKSVPLVTSYKGPIEVRGEVVMRRSIFEKLNKQRKDKGEPPFANPRNAAAGAIRQLDPQIAASRQLDFFAYQLIAKDNNLTIDTQREALFFLKNMGFQTESNSQAFHIFDDGKTGLWSIYAGLLVRRESFDYEVDGVVIKVNEFAGQRRLGTTSSRPKWAMAFKFPARQATTRINSVTFQVGRTGAITPVAELEPVKLAGATISRATLHNFDEVKRLGVMVGDTVLLERAGDVIPKVVKVIEEKRTGDEVPIERPSECPVCGSPVYQPDGEVAICCINGSCPAKVIDNLRHFVSRSGRDIDGVGKETLAKLVEAGLVKDPADLYFLTEEGLEGLPGVKGKTISNILSSIEASRDKGLESIVSTLGIPKVGRHLAPILVEHFPTIDELMNATVEELENIDGIGPIVAQNIVLFFQQPKNQELIEKFRRAGIKLTVDQPDQSTEPLALTGKTFVLTGKLSVSRGEMENQIKAAGGKISSNVSKSTSYVIVGDKPGSKLKKAEALDVPTLTEDDFRTLYL